MIKMPESDQREARERDGQIARKSHKIIMTLSRRNERLPVPVLRPWPWNQPGVHGR